MSGARDSMKDAREGAIRAPERGAEGDILFDVRNLSKVFKIGTASLRAVDDISFTIRRGETLGVVGESGSGKSTLGRCLLGLLPASGGEARYEGKDLLKQSPAEWKAIRRQMQMIFQNPKSSFNAKRDIGKALLSVARFYGMDTASARARIAELLELTGLPDEVLSHRSDQLSGGQLQRLAIVRALIPSPRFIVADEAVSALDVSVQAQILGLIEDMKQGRDLTVLFVAHDLAVVEYICDRVLVMYLGTIVERADAAALFTDPKHPYTRALIAARPLVDPAARQGRAEIRAPEGEIPNALDLPGGCRFHTRCPERIAGVCDKTQPPEVDIGSGHSVCCHLYESGNAR